MNPPSTTPRTDAIFALLDKAFLADTGYEHRIALREGARCGVEDLERELSILKSKREAAVRYGADSLESDSIENSCNCLERNREAHLHKPGCKYRLISERDAAREECERLQKLIADQPCDSDCRSVCGGMFTPTYGPGEPPMKCDCWKSEALTNKL